MSEGKIMHNKLKRKKTKKKRMKAESHDSCYVMATRALKRSRVSKEILKKKKRAFELM